MPDKNSVPGKGRSAVRRLLARSKWPDSESERRVREFCELAYKHGYYAGQAAAARRRRASTPAPNVAARAQGFTFVADTPFPCPACGELIPPGVEHSHEESAMRSRVVSGDKSEGSQAEKDKG